jgi:hypothetical protein
MAWINYDGLWVPRLPAASFISGGTVYGSILLDAATEKAAFIFPISKAGDLHSVGFRFGTVTQAPVNGLKVSFQDVDATGAPDGTIDQYRIVTSGIVSNAWLDVGSTGPMTTDGTDGGVKRTVARMDYLAMVVEFANFSAGDSLNISAIVTPGSGTGDLTSNCYGAQYTASWVRNGFWLPCMALKYSDGSYPFHPGLFPFKALDTATNYSNTTTLRERALYFKLPFPAKAEHGWVATSVTATRDMILYEGTTQIAACSMPALSAAPRAAAYFTFASQEALTLNTVYRLSLKPTSAGYIQAVVAEVQDAAMLGHLEGGTDFYLSERDNTGAWTETTTKRPMIGIGLSAFDDGAGGAGGLLVHPGMSGGMRG